MGKADKACKERPSHSAAKPFRVANNNFGGFFIKSQSKFAYNTWQRLISQVPSYSVLLTIFSVFFKSVLTSFDCFFVLKKKIWNDVVRSVAGSVGSLNLFHHFDHSYSHSCFHLVDIFSLVEEQKTKLCRQQHFFDIPAPSVTISFFFFDVSRLSLITSVSLKSSLFNSLPIVHQLSLPIVLRRRFQHLLTIVYRYWLFRVQFYDPDSLYLRCQRQFRVLHLKFVSCLRFNPTLAQLVQVSLIRALIRVVKSYVPISCVAVEFRSLFAFQPTFRHSTSTRG